MDLEKFVDSIFSREPRYESVDTEYLRNGAFTLTAERDNRKVTYKSHETYTSIVESPLLSLFSKRLGGPMEFKRIAPIMTLEDSEKKEKVHILYDKENDTLAVRIVKNDRCALQITKYGSQILCNDPSIDDETALKMVLDYAKIFKRQQKLLDVETHQKMH